MQMKNGIKIPVQFLTAHTTLLYTYILLTRNYILTSKNYVLATPIYINIYILIIQNAELFSKKAHYQASPFICSILFL